MSVLARSRNTSSTAVRPRAARRARAAARAATSSTTTLRRVIVTLFTCAILSVIADAQGIVHAGKGMNYGPMRDATLAVGQTALTIGDDTHVTWAWDKLAAERGYNPQPSVPPLLATGSGHKNGSGRPKTHPSGAPATPTATARPHPTRTTTVRPTATARPKRHVVAPPPVRKITRANPLRLLVTGDSLTGYMGPQLVNEASGVGPVHGFTDTHDGTGLTRPDFVDWSIVATQQVAQDHPDAIVVMIGGNDFQNMVLGNKVFIAGTRAWTREYQRRAAIVMRVWAQHGHARVYWLSMPPARDTAWAYDDAHINMALQRAAKQVPGVRYMNVLGPVTNHGRYTDFVSVNGVQTLIREPDGVHLNIAGSDIVAHEVLPVIVHDWHLRQAAHPAGHKKPLKKHHTR